MTNDEQTIAPANAPSPGAAVPKRAASLTEILERGGRVAILDDRSSGREPAGNCRFIQRNIL